MITDRRADADLCGYVYCKFSGIGTSVMQAAVDEMIASVSAELNQLNAGTAAMTKAQYDPNGSGVDVTAQIYKCTKNGKVYALTGHGGLWPFQSSCGMGQRRHMDSQRQARSRLLRRGCRGRRHNRCGPLGVVWRQGARLRRSP